MTKLWFISARNCIDVGCHKGEVLDEMLALAPQGKHYAFEPIPALFQALRANYAPRVTILPFALSDADGTTTFQYVKNAPAYSGLRRRKYDIKDVDIEEIKIEQRRLDDLIPIEKKIDLIKIDVEGGEMDVLKGSIELLNRCKPLVLFECGLGASDHYGYTPTDVFIFFEEQVFMPLYTLKDWIKGNAPLTLQDFVHLYESGKEYYFVADNK